jgi:hypothetical protein
MAPDPHNPHSEKNMGRAMLGTVLLCAASGAGIGVFFEAPEIGGMVGGVIGILLGLWLIPSLMRDLQD